MTETKTGSAIQSGDREIVVTRVFDATPAVVYQAWTEPERIAAWWGPHGFTTTTHQMDVRPGGVWRFIMHGPDGVDYKNHITYREVVPAERLVYDHGGEGDTADIRFQVTVTFEKQGNQTRLTMRSLFPTAAERERVEKEFGAIEGAHQTLERLAQSLRSAS